MFKLKIRESGKGWSSVRAEDFVNPRFMEEFGNAILFHIIQEARNDLKTQITGPGKPEGIPDDPKFFESFGFDSKGPSIEIYSTWPTIEAIIEGKPAYPMKWLTKPYVTVVPFQQKNGRKTVLFRTAPDRLNAWKHPGFAPHSFMERGIEKAVALFEKQMANQARKVFSKTPLL